MPPKRLSVQEYTAGIRAGSRTVLGRAITLVESTLPTDQALAQEVLQAVLPHTGHSLRVGITGVPGVGKSTFIEALGRFLVEEKGHRLAVLAVDPSSQRGGGSILGDKTRMPWLSAHPAAFIRPSPAGNSLGGVARATREALLLCEAAGHDVIFVETVGVGQSETTVHGMVDFFLLLMLAGAGDELQGMKRGIMEMADALCITKADHGNEQAARRARVDYQNALHLFPASPSGQTTPVLLTSAVAGTGLAEVWEVIENYAAATRQNGYFEQRRRQQQLQWLHQSIVQALESRFYTTGTVRQQLPAMQQAVAAGQLTPFAAAAQLLGLA
ncbi:methylmalonyl Co-A mutase-associated GTPase MeaB [Hymenobacter negativus]|uniref:Methylmalonyl Co-A mutase-associated GTPase MeaB n=1 Tax=Hymenobacter negativus TaxID=2795026 RepID=A0ABS3QJP2_9BACT|nr:methylmalonyl Co-A mutase-associated GTPase MeaB [Hymenobacter negativus]MBO2011471.1 methylmalonyl Co-A mutase-associated GTPase MeaB [Hymenobacter negativus]